MNKTILILAAAGGLAASTGCIKNTTLVSVNPDGSGTLTVSDAFSPQVSAMLSGMGGAVEGIMESMGEAVGGSLPGDAGAGESRALAMPRVDFSELMKTAAENRTAKLGPGVELVSSSATETDDGWKGYQATYKFADINKVHVGVGGADLTEAGMASAEEEPLGFTFRFTPGNPARLEIVPAATTETNPDAAGLPGDTDLAEAADAMGTDMARMVAPMLSGMRLSLMVKVNGEIVETNSDHRSAEHPDIITVLDMPVEKMVGHPEAMSILSSQAPDMLARLRALDLPGVKLEDEAKTISVLFK
jgi:hypothetical protein